jgi:hypothetical protein
LRRRRKIGQQGVFPDHEKFSRFGPSTSENHRGGFRAMPSLTERCHPGRRELLAVAALAFAMGFPALTFPLGLDQGIYSVNAARMLRGHALYSGAWDMKSPGIFFMYVLPISLGGFRVWPIQVLHLLLHAATTLAVFRLMAWRVGRGPAWATCFCWLMHSFGWGTPVTNGQPDDWMLPFYLWGFYLLASAWIVEPERARWRAFVAGLFLGWTTALRSTMAPAAILLPLCWLAMAGAAPEFSEALPEGVEDVRAPAGRRFWVLLGFYVLGGAAMTALVLSYFVLTGSMSDMIYSQFVWVRDYARTVADWTPDGLQRAYWRARTEWSSFFYDWGLILWAIPLGAGGLISWRLRGRRIPWRGMALWALGLTLGASSMLIQLKFFNYHHWPLIVFLSMAAGMALWAAADWAIFLWRRGAEASSSKKRRAWRFAGALVAIGSYVLLYREPTGFKEYRKRYEQAVEFALQPEMYRLEHYARFKFHHISEPESDYIFAETIRALTPQDQKPKVYIWGFRPAIYFCLGVIGPSRFPYNLPLRAHWSPPEWLERLETEVMADPPDFLLIGRSDNFQWVVGDWRPSSEVMPPWLEKDLRENFRFVRADSHLALWQRVRPPSANEKQSGLAPTEKTE